MTLKEAMIYRGENESTLALMLATRPLDVRRWCKPGGLEKLSAQRLQQLAKALDVSTDRLLGIADPLEDEFIAYYGQVSRQLTESDRRELMALVRLKAEMKKGHDQK